MFDVLIKLEIENHLRKAAEKHLSYMRKILQNFEGLAGENFVRKFVRAFEATGSPIFINLDHNVSGQPISRASEVVKELETIIRSTAGYVCGYKLNFQSLLTFLLAGSTNFPDTVRHLYSKVCKENFDVEVEPAVWLDQKLADIPSTNFQAADILYKLGFDAIHVLPQIGPDSVGAVQLAAERNKRAGIIHVVNLTHSGYTFVKREYFKGSTLDNLRRNALGRLSYPVKLQASVNVALRATGVVEPANRPYELFQGYTKLYGKKSMVISIGIGPQGAMPGCALYAGATCEGIGRFIFRGDKGIDNPENISRKARLSEYCALLALSARYAGKPYPVEEVLATLKEFSPRIDKETVQGLRRVYGRIRNKGLS